MTVEVPTPSNPVQPGDIVIIKWVDSKNYSGWQHYHPAEVTECRSLGWILEATQEAIVLTQTRTDTEDETMVNGVIAIPQGCIMHVEILRRAATVPAPD